MEFPARTRREFLVHAGGALGVAVAASSWPAIAAAHAHALSAVTAGGSTALGFFSADEARDVEALAAQVVPTDETPGAREAGALYFIDRSLQTWAIPQAATFRSGLHDFQAKFMAAHPGGTFAAADATTQFAFLASIDKTDFFKSIRSLTVIGLFALPQYGGNRDGIGWRLIGFDDRHAFSPPFGHYDRDYPGFALPGAKS